MKHLIKSAVVLAAAVSVAVGIFTVQTVSAENSWKPEKPINLVVPWGAGGATDGVSRQTAMALEGHLVDVGEGACRNTSRAAADRKLVCLSGQEDSDDGIGQRYLADNAERVSINKQSSMDFLDRDLERVRAAVLDESQLVQQPWRFLDEGVAVQRFPNHRGEVADGQQPACLDGLP